MFLQGTPESNLQKFSLEACGLVIENTTRPGNACTVMEKNSLNCMIFARALLPAFYRHCWLIHQCSQRLPKCDSHAKQHSKRDTSSVDNSYPDDLHPMILFSALLPRIICVTFDMLSVVIRKDTLRQRNAHPNRRKAPFQLSFRAGISGLSRV